jgi:uncharacterized protein (DUF488 family)
LGIESAERKDLATKEDYRKLFEEYRAGVLLTTTKLIYMHMRHGE